MPDPRPYFIDSNIFLRFFVPDDHHKECRSFLRDLKAGSFKGLTSTLVLVEIQYVLGSFYKFPKTKVITALESIMTVRNLTIEDQINPLLALQLYKKYSVKFVDCLIASHPQIQAGDLTIVSYDKDFDKLETHRLEPKEILVS